jgi:hypothetical protein
MILVALKNIMVNGPGHVEAGQAFEPADLPDGKNGVQGGSAEPYGKRMVVRGLARMASSAEEQAYRQRKTRATSLDDER